MNPSVGDFFWQHMPAWIWPIIIVGMAGFFLFKVIEASEVVAKIFGKLGWRIHERATRLRRLLAHAERMEELLENTNDKLECATAYLVLDADWHRETEVMLAERYPGLSRLLPGRTPYTTFARQWREGSRPPGYEETWRR